MGCERTDYIMVGHLLTDEEARELYEKDESFFDGEPYKYSMTKEGFQGFSLVGTNPMSHSRMVFGIVLASGDYEGLGFTEITEFDLRNYQVGEQAYSLTSTFNRLFNQKREMTDINLYIFTRWS